MQSRTGTGRVGQLLLILMRGPMGVFMKKRREDALHHPIKFNISPYSLLASLTYLDSVPPEAIMNIKNKEGSGQCSVWESCAVIRTCDWKHSTPSIFFLSWESRCSHRSQHRKYVIRSEIKVLGFFIFKYLFQFNGRSFQSSSNKMICK